MKTLWGKEKLLVTNNLREEEVFTHVSLPDTFRKCINPLPHMPILGTSISATNKDMML